MDHLYFQWQIWNIKLLGIHMHKSQTFLCILCTNNDKYTQMQHWSNEKDMRVVHGRNWLLKIFFPHHMIWRVSALIYCTCLNFWGVAVSLYRTRYILKYFIVKYNYFIAWQCSCNNSIFHVPLLDMMQTN